MSKLDIFQELQNEKIKNVDLQQSLLLKEAYSILNETGRSRLHPNQINSQVVVSVKKTILNPTKIFANSDIQNVCIKNRLRFLALNYYKSTLPYDVHIKCSAFEIEMDKPISLKIVTEGQNFKAKFPSSQHLIFADLGNGEYYFITKWGNEYSKYRKLMVLPFRNIKMHLFSIFTFALLLTTITPTKFLTSDPLIGYFSMIRFAFYFWCVIILTALSAYYIIGIRKNLNSGEWDNSSFM